MFGKGLKPKAFKRDNERDRGQPSGARFDRNASNRPWIVYAAIGLLILGLPLALLGAVLPVNEYTAFESGQTGMVDCDGPFGVLILAVPAFAVYAGIFLVACTSSAFRKRSAVIVALISISMAALVIPNMINAVMEMSERNHREVCG